MASWDKASVEVLCRAAVHSHSLKIWALDSLDVILCQSGIQYATLSLDICSRHLVSANRHLPET